MAQWSRVSDKEYEYKPGRKAKHYSFQIPDNSGISQYENETIILELWNHFTLIPSIFITFLYMFTYISVAYHLFYYLFTYILNIFNSWALKKGQVTINNKW